MFEVLTDVQHVLQRPTMYVGYECGTRVAQSFVMADGRVERRDATIDHVALKCFDEIIVNAADCCLRTKRATYVAVVIDEKGFSVTNDGCDIPVEYNEEWHAYVPETLFGTLRSSCNYDDAKERHGAGVNGIGCKLTNIFASHLSLELTDATTHYAQTFASNMQVRSQPEIAPIGARAPHTVRVVVVPDATRLSWNEDTRAVCARRVYDIALCTPVAVTLCGVAVASDTARYASFLDEPPLEMLLPGYRIVLGVTSRPAAVSLANGSFTSDHGAHVAQSMRKVHEALGSGCGTEAQWRRFVEDRLFVLVIAKLDRPVFASNEKTCVRAPLRPEPRLDKVHERALRASPVAAAWLAWLAENTQSALQRDERKRGAKVRVAKLDDACAAGTAQWAKCTLILTEGDSAKSFAVAGVSVVGREFYGIFPLRGKVRNVRDATAVQTDENIELRAIKTILNLRTGVAPEQQQLRYGRVLIMTDQDVDGFHIKGLVMNFLDAQFEGIIGVLKLDAMSTPLIKATWAGSAGTGAGAGTHEFFSSAEYAQFRDGKPAPTRVKYYKGLGTSTPQEAKQYFADIARYTTSYSPDGKEMLAAFFARTAVQTRKTAIRGAMAAAAPSTTQRTQTIGEFVTTELTTYSVDAVLRAIPSVVDGLKPSQRKVLWTTLRGKRGETKVAQLAAYIAHETAYHHGEASMQQTIVAMAQDFVGSNNAALLLPIGQFGSRRMGGSDAASARYIFTALAPVATLAFPVADLALVAQQEEDGQVIEPRHLLPVIPWLLVNGCVGIATGFSTTVPMHDVRDVCARLREYIVDRTQGSPLAMRVAGYTGAVAREAGRYTTSTVVTRAAAKGVHVVSELPVGVWTDAYKARLDALIDKKVVTKYTNESTDVAVKFVVHTAEPAKLAMSKHTSTVNMHALDSDGALRLWTVESIIEYFCAFRAPFYEQRKSSIARALGEEIEKKRGTVRFIELVLSGGANEIFAADDAVHAIRARGFREDVLDTPLRACTQERRARLERDLAALTVALERHEAVAPVDTWLAEIDALRAHLEA